MRFSNIGRWYFSKSTKVLTILSVLFWKAKGPFWLPLKSPEYLGQYAVSTPKSANVVFNFSSAGESFNMTSAIIFPFSSYMMTLESSYSLVLSLHSKQKKPHP